MQKLEVFKQQYWGLGDAVVRSICYYYSRKANDKTLLLQIECMNHTKSSSWELISISLTGVKDFRLIELEQHSNDVLFDVAFRLHGGEYLFAFDSVEGEDATIEDMMESNFFVRCRDFEYEVVEQL